MLTETPHLPPPQGLLNASFGASFGQDFRGPDGRDRSFPAIETGREGFRRPATVTT